MKHLPSAFAVIHLLTSIASSQENTWPQWRGPLATGVAPGANPPARWNEGRNIRWRTALPGRGHSSPIVWNDRIFLTTAVPTGRQTDPAALKAMEARLPPFMRRRARLPREIMAFEVLALKRSDGSVLWKQTVCEKAPFAGTHRDGSWASASVTTDGERVYAYFGSYGLYALDMDGKPLWDAQLGTFKMKANFGEGTSPVLCGDQIIVNQDQEGPSFIVALDKKTGAELWRKSRDEKTSWSTPLVVDHKDTRQVVVSATSRIRSYSPADGSVLWEAGGMTGNVIPCPLFYKGLVLCMSGFRGNTLMAIRLDKAKGDITGNTEAIAWSRKEDAPYCPSPLLYDGLVYYGKTNKGLLSCADAATGKIHYSTQELPGIRTLYASIVGANGRVYIVGHDGQAHVIQHGREFKILASNKLEDTFVASPAIVNQDLYMRGEKTLYCIAESGD